MDLTKLKITKTKKKSEYTLQFLKDNNLCVKADSQTYINPQSIDCSEMDFHSHGIVGSSNVHQNSDKKYGH